MRNTPEISALMNLIDDPDEVVYASVSTKIISMGREIIPNLESIWETADNYETVKRVEYLIHRVNFQDVLNELENWAENDENLVEGALIVSRYFYPDLNLAPFYKDLEKLRRNIWLELNSYLTPIEKITVFNGIFYNYYKQSGVEITYDNYKPFLLNNALEMKKGNAYSNGIIYLILCAMLDLPVQAINIPRQFILGYFNNFNFGQNHEKIVFYIDPLGGNLYSHKDIINYFNKLNVESKESYFEPVQNKEIIRILLLELSKCFKEEKDFYKYEDLGSLAAALA
ncbi:MAG: transglutaminase family protein [Bacteroidetes bacterium]|nr:transglutaminase family protein [Bacteroidota bacterium]